MLHRRGCGAGCLTHCHKQGSSSMMQFGSASNSSQGLVPKPCWQLLEVVFGYQVSNCSSCFHVLQQRGLTLFRRRCRKKKRLGKQQLTSTSAARESIRFQGSCLAVAAVACSSQGLLEPAVVDRLCADSGSCWHYVVVTPRVELTCQWWNNKSAAQLVPVDWCLSALCHL